MEHSHQSENLDKTNSEKVEVIIDDGHNWITNKEKHISLPEGWEEINLKDYIKFHSLKNPSKIETINIIGKVSLEFINYLSKEEIDEIYQAMYWINNKPFAQEILNYEDFSWFSDDIEIKFPTVSFFALRDLDSEYCGEKEELELLRNRLLNDELEYLPILIAYVTKLKEVNIEKLSIKFDAITEEKINSRKEIFSCMPVNLAMYVYKYFMGYEFAHGKPQINKNIDRVVSQEIRDKVWRRALGKCEQCGSQEKLHFDHIVPVSKGGSNTYRNVQLLCEKCNLTKSNKIG